MIAKISCPFCGNTEHYIAGSDRITSTFFTECHNCGARGPQTRSMKGAETAWNTRKEHSIESVNDIKRDLGLYNSG